MDTVTTLPGLRPQPEQEAIEKLMGLAIFGEKVAAKIYLLLAELKGDFAPLLKKFARMEANHGAWFLDASRSNGIEPDRAFADNELNYLVAQVDEHFKKKDFDALIIVQGFIVESLAIATYESFLPIAHKYAGTFGVLRVHVNRQSKNFSQSLDQVRQSWPPSITSTESAGRACASSRCAAANRSSRPNPRYSGGDSGRRFFI